MASASRTTILTLAGVLTPLLAYGQGKSELRGRVVSETGEAIAGATITLAQIGYAIRTDSTGASLLAGSPGSTLVFPLRAAGLRGDAAAVTRPRRAGLSQEFKLISEATVLPESNPSDRVLRGSIMDLDGRALAYASARSMAVADICRTIRGDLPSRRLQAGSLCLSGGLDSLRKKSSSTRRRIPPFVCA